MGFNIWTDCPRVPITQLLEFIVDNRGKTVPTAQSGHKLIATNCVTNNTLFPVYEKIRYLSDETYRTWFRAHPIPGDILFVNKGTPGRVCMVPDPIDFCIAQDMIALRADDAKIYNKYLFAVLRSHEIQQQIYNTSVGDVIPHFKKQFMDQLLIPVPDRKIQEAIGDLYYALSYKVEHNKKINDNLAAYHIGSGQRNMVALLPVIIPAALKSLVRDSSNKMNLVSFRFQAQDNFGSPDIHTPRHAGDECNKSIVDGFADFRFQRRDHDGFGLVELMRPMASKAGAMQAQFRFGWHRKITPSKIGYKVSPKLVIRLPPLRYNGITKNGDII